MNEIEKSRIQEITDLHAEIGGLFMQSLDKAILIGSLLLQQKKSMDHGEWIPWIEKNLPFKERTARNYLRVYRERDNLKRQAVADLNTAYKLLAEPKEDKTEREVQEYIKNAPDYQPSEDIQIYHGAFQEICEGIPDGSIDHVLTDPPYPREYLHLWRDLSEVAARILKPSGFCICYAAPYHLPTSLRMLSEHLTYYWQMILIQKTETSSIHSVRIRPHYKPILIFQKPPHKTQEEYVSDIIEGSGREKSLHVWQQGEGESIELLKKFTKEGELILDPFGGSGTVAEACRATNRRCIIIEKEEKYVEVIKARMASYIPVEWKEEPQEKEQEVREKAVVEIPIF